MSSENKKPAMSLEKMKLMTLSMYFMEAIDKTMDSVKDLEEAVISKCSPEELSEFRTLSMRLSVDRIYLRLGENVDFTKLTLDIIDSKTGMLSKLLTDDGIADIMPEGLASLESIKQLEEAGVHRIAKIAKHKLAGLETSKFVSDSKVTKILSKDLSGTGSLKGLKGHPAGYKGNGSKPKL